MELDEFLDRLERMRVCATNLLELTVQITELLVEHAQKNNIPISFILPKVRYYTTEAKKLIEEIDKAQPRFGHRDSPPPDWTEPQ